MGPDGGFYGTYGAPSIVTTAVNKLRILESEEGRRLLRADNEYDLFDEVSRDL